MILKILRVHEECENNNQMPEIEGNAFDIQGEKWIAVEYRNKKIVKHLLGRIERNEIEGLFTVFLKYRKINCLAQK